MSSRSTHLSSPGIYRIDGPKGKFYVGSAQWLSRRWIEHKRDLRRGDHGNPKLQAAWNKYGESAFSLTVLEYVADEAKLIEREQYWIDTLDAANAGYNVLPTAGSHLGRKHSEETKKLMSVAHTGRKHGPMSEEQKKLLSEINTGKKLSEETRRRMGDARRGKPRPAHVCAAVSAAKAGKPLSEAHRQSLRVPKAKWTEERRQKCLARNARKRQEQLTNAASSGI